MHDARSMTHDMMHDARSMTHDMMHDAHSMMHNELCKMYNATCIVHHGFRASRFVLTKAFL